MQDQLNRQRQAQREALAALKRAAIDALVDRGYAVRGKTTSQIREILRHRPTLPHDAQGGEVISRP
jgi:hypothetical protein